MKLPNVEQAMVAEGKITRYLLSETHEDGQHKAKFFMRFGFTIDHWKMLAEALLKHAADHEVASIVSTSYGQHYVIEGSFDTPSGEAPNLRTVWAIERNHNQPRLITAYPLKAAKEEDDD